jgi:hypothetical protein
MRDLEGLRELWYDTPQADRAAGCRQVVFSAPASATGFVMSERDCSILPGSREPPPHAARKSGSRPALGGNGKDCAEDVETPGATADARRSVDSRFLKQSCCSRVRGM